MARLNKVSGCSKCRISRNLDSGCFELFCHLDQVFPPLLAIFLGILRHPCLTLERTSELVFYMVGLRSEIDIVSLIMLGFRYLNKTACQHLVRFREQRPRHGAKDNLKELIDEWLQFRSADRFKDDVFFRGILGMHDVQSDQVLCQVLCVTVPVSVLPANPFSFLIPFLRPNRGQPFIAPPTAIFSSSLQQRRLAQA